MSLLLFDIDGTLLTTSGVGRTALQKTLEQCCEQTICTDAVSFSGKTDPQILREILEANELSDSWCEAFKEYAFETFQSLFEQLISPEEVTVLPGVSELLAELAVWPDTTLGLLTGNLEPTGWMKLKAGQIDHHFSFGAFGSDHADRNELPAIALERACNMAGRRLQPSESIIIGDTPRDIRCGQHAGMRTIAVCTGRYDHEALAKADPDVLLDDLQDIEAFVEAIN